MPPRAQQSPDGWNEYKRLVLAELERLTQVTEKLREQSVLVRQEVLDEIEGLITNIHDRIDKKHQSISDDIKEAAALLKTEVNSIEKQLSSYKKSQQIDTTITSKWGFWAAVISIIGSLIVSLISLIINLKVSP